MKRSRTEIRATLVKAGRGAGLPLGLAEDLAAAATDLLSRDPAKAAQVTAALDPDPVGIAFTGPAAIDACLAGETPQTFSAPGTADLATAMIDLARRDRALAATLTRDGDTLTLTEGRGDPAPVPLGPVTVPEDHWQIWDSLAARTYVPETEASRAAGAGAGLTDND